MIGKEFHLSMDCIACHQGNKLAKTKEKAHQGRIARPSDNLKTCGICHITAGQNYAKALHYTSLGQREGVKHRFSAAELKTFDQKVLKNHADPVTLPAEAATSNRRLSAASPPAFSRAINL